MTRVFIRMQPDSAADVPCMTRVIRMQPDLAVVAAVAGQAKALRLFPRRCSQGLYGSLLSVYICIISTVKTSSYAV
jgi:hypothetical protein